MSVPCLYWGAQDWTQHCRCGPSSAEEGEGVTPSTCRQCDVFPDADLKRLLALLATKARCWLLIQWDLHGLLYKAASKTVSLQHVLVHTTIPSQVSQVADIPLNVSIAIWFVKHSSQFCIFEGAPCPVVQVISEDVKTYFPQRQPLEYTISD